MVLGAASCLHSERNKIHFFFVIQRCGLLQVFLSLFSVTIQKYTYTRRQQMIDTILLFAIRVAGKAVIYIFVHTHSRARTKSLVGTSGATFQREDYFLVTLEAKMGFYQHRPFLARKKRNNFYTLF